MEALATGTDVGTIIQFGVGFYPACLMFEKPADLNIGSAAEAVCYGYIENIEKDISGAGILFAPVHKCFKSTRPVGGYFAESVTDPREL